jgi:hypothetical protein
MILERTNYEILIRLPSNFDVSELQSLLDYLKYKELTSISEAKTADADELSDEVNQSIWKKAKDKRGLK